MAVIIFKAVEKCNSRCLYCDAIKKNQETIMSYDILELVFKRINEYLLTDSSKKVFFTWHGGEPCLLGPDYFYKALEFQNKHCSKTKNRIEHAMQSNLTIINQELIDVFKKMGIKQIGTSFEPIPNIRGIGKDVDSEIYNKKFMQGINLLNKNNMLWGIIYVVNKRSLQDPLKLFYYLTNLNPHIQPMLNNIYVHNEDKHNLKISHKEYADFLGTILPVWWKNRIRYPHIKPFDNILQTANNNKMLFCEDSGLCAYEWVYIGPTGESSHCCKAGDFNILSYGNIQNHMLLDILHDKKRDQLQKRQELLPLNKCNDCRFWGLCHGGCPLNSFLEHEDFLNDSTSCGWKKYFLEEYFEPITGVKINLPPTAN